MFKQIYKPNSVHPELVSGSPKTRTKLPYHLSTFTVTSKL